VVCRYTEAEWRRVGELIGGADPSPHPDQIHGSRAITVLGV
jgi:hypothetical protein